MQSRHIGGSHAHKVTQLSGCSTGQSVLTVQHRRHVVSRRHQYETDVLRLERVQ